MTHLPQATEPAAAVYDARAHGASVETLMADPDVQESDNSHSQDKTMQARQDKEISLTYAAEAKSA